MLQINHRELKKLIKVNYKTEIPLLVYGGYGLGKSQVVISTSKEIAKEQKREFVEWDKTTNEEKEKLFKNPERYFVVLDIRTSGLDATDLKGIPNFREDKKTIEWKIPYFLNYTTIKDSKGCIFFDELSLGVPIVLNSLYKLVYDRCVDGCKISDGWSMVMATNREEDGAFVHTIPKPLLDRCCEVELLPPNLDDWVTDFAIPNKIDSRIIGYITFKSGDLNRIETNSNQKQTSPRGWERISKLIKDIPLNEIDLIVKSAIAEGIAVNFVAFCKIQEKLNLEEVIKNPELIKHIKDIGTKYFLITALCDKYKDKKINFDKIIEVSKVFESMKEEEYTALLWRMAKQFNEEQFDIDFEECKEDKLLEKMGRLIMR